MKPEIEDLLERLGHFQTKHRMQFGMHPDNDLILEAIKAIQALSQSDADVAEEVIPASKQVRVTRRTKGAKECLPISND